MKKVFSLIIIFLSVILTACGSNDSEASNDSENEEIVLKVATHADENHYTYKYGIKPWMDRVTELTEGQVQFDFYPSGQLSTEGDEYELVTSKATDIIFASQLSVQFPLVDVASLAGMYNTAEEGTAGYWDITSNGPLFEEMTSKGIRPLFSFALPPYIIATAKEKVETLEDLKGKIIMSAAPGLLQVHTENLGATATTLNIVDTRDALSRNTIDGVYLTWNSIVPYQIENALKYGVENPPLSGWGASFVINEDVYQDLPENVKEAIDEAGEETVEIMAKGITEENEENKKIAEESGVEMTTLGEEEIKRWEESLSPANEDWINKMEKEGYPAQEVIDQFTEAVKNSK